MFCFFVIWVNYRWAASDFHLLNSDPVFQQWMQTDSVWKYPVTMTHRVNLKGQQCSSCLHMLCEWCFGGTLPVTHIINRAGSNRCDLNIESCEWQRAAYSRHMWQPGEEKWQHQQQHTESHCNHPSTQLKSSFKQTVKSISGSTVWREEERAGGTEFDL